MYETMEDATARLEEGEFVEYCDFCEAWTIVGTDGYPICYCA